MSNLENTIKAMHEARMSQYNRTWGTIKEKVKFASDPSDDENQQTMQPAPATAPASGQAEKPSFLHQVLDYFNKSGKGSLAGDLGYGDSPKTAPDTDSISNKPVSSPDASPKGNGYNDKPAAAPGPNALTGNPSSSGTGLVNNPPQVKSDSTSNKSDSNSLFKIGGPGRFNSSPQDSKPLLFPDKPIVDIGGPNASAKPQPRTGGPDAGSISNKSITTVPQSFPRTGGPDADSIANKTFAAASQPAAAAAPFVPKRPAPMVSKAAAIPTTGQTVAQSQAPSFAQPTFRSGGQSGPALSPAAPQTPNWFGQNAQNVNNQKTPITGRSGGRSGPSQSQEQTIESTPMVENRLISSFLTLEAGKHNGNMFNEAKKLKTCPKCGKLLAECTCKPVKEETINEAKKKDSSYELYHNQYSGAVQHALDYHHGTKGIQVSDEDRWHHIGSRSQRPKGEGETAVHNIPALDQNGNHHVVHMQIYNRGGNSKPYELNTYTTKLPKGKKMHEALEEMEVIDERNLENKKKKNLVIKPKERVKDPIPNRFDTRNMKREEVEETEMNTIEEKIKTKADRYAEYIGKERAKQGIRKIMGSEKKPEVKEDVEEIKEISKNKVAGYIKAAEPINKDISAHVGKGEWIGKSDRSTLKKTTGGLETAKYKLSGRAKVNATEDVKVDFSEEEIEFIRSIMGDE